MRARIIKDGSFWVGEVYGRWYFFGVEKVGWGSVTGRCITKIGAKYELKKWKRERCFNEFEL